MTGPFEHSEFVTPIDLGVSEAPHNPSGFVEVPVDAIHVDWYDQLAVPIDRIPTDSPAPGDVNHAQYTTGHKQFSTDNGNAFATFERGSHDVFMGQATLSSGQQVYQISGRTVGRKAITLYVPSTLYAAGGTTSTPTGVIIGESEGKVQMGDGVQLPAGSSITISTEAPIWVGVLPGQTTGFVQYIEEVNPAGGALGTF